MVRVVVLVVIAVVVHFCWSIFRTISKEKTGSLNIKIHSHFYIPFR